MAMQCPICKKPVDEAELGKPGSYFPFCSDRCRLIDLGRWFSGRYAIPVTREEDAAPSADQTGERKGRTDQD
jgi:uncharacterized protein